MLPDLDRDFVATYLRPHRSRLAVLAALFAATVGLQLANPLLARSFIDRAQSGAPFGELTRLAVAFLVAALVAQAASVVETWVADDLGWRTTNALRVDVTRHVLVLDDGFHAEHGAGELLERIDGDVSAIAGFFSRFVVHVVGSAVFLVGVLALLWVNDLRVGAVLTLTAGVTVVFLLQRGGFVGRHSLASRRINGELSGYLEERLSALPDLKANGADGDTLRGLDVRLAERFRADRGAVTAAALFADGVNTIFLIGSAAALLLAVTSPTASLGGSYLVFRYTGMLRMPLERLARHLNSFQRATGGMVRVQALLATAPSIVDPPSPRALPDGPLAVDLDGVTFAHGAEPVLRDVSLTLAPGEVLGLVGRTGSGKTTLARLLFRLHDPTSGSVQVGGVDLRETAVADLRHRVAFVTQDVHLFGASLRDNVRLFDDSVSDATLVEAFHALGLDEWLADLPGGLDTVLGPTGRGLSAGEAQLVALARAFLGAPGLVVLDEASSRLDPHTEAMVETALRRLLAGRTGVVIAHRLRTIERVDSVAVVDDGHVVEHGRRAALAADPGSRFAALLAAGASALMTIDESA